MNVPARFLNAKRLKRAIPITILSSFLLVLSSCIPNLRKPDLAPPVPEHFNRPASPENSAQLRIEEFFSDPMLIEVIERALVGNQELRILNENIQIASNEVLARRGTYLPFVTAGGGPSLNKLSNFTPEGTSLKDDAFLPGMFIPNPYGNFLLGFDLFWQIDIWRQLRNARDAAIQRFIGAAQERNYFVTRLVAEIADNYYALVALDKRMENLDRIIALQEQSLEIAKARKQFARGTDLPVQRFQAEVRKNQAEKLIVRQDIIQGENRINFLAGRFPQPVARMSADIEKFIDLTIHALSLGVPPQLLQNRPDIRQAERELAAAGLDVKVARARFYPVVTITGGVGYEAFNMRYLFLTPESLIYNIAAGLVGPVINFKAIRADYLTANAKQLQAVYNYQRVIINAFTEVINRISKVENYARSIEIKKQQVQSLTTAVVDATSLYRNPRAQLPIDYLDVLTAQNELFEAIRNIIETKGQQLSAVVNTYQALGGGSYLLANFIPQAPQTHHKWWRPFVGDSPPGAAGFPGPGQISGETTPGSTQNTPGSTQNTPGAAYAKPGAGDTKPGAGDVKPGAGDTKPGAADIKPGAGDTKPGSGETKPGSGDRLPDPVPGLDPIPGLGVAGAPGTPISSR